MTTSHMIAWGSRRAVELDRSEVSQELSLLLHLLQDDSQQEIISQDNLHDLDWDRFMKLVSHHRVFPLVYLKLKEWDPARIPARVIQTLRHQYHTNTMRMLHLGGEMSRICETLAQGGIRTLVLKGPALALQLYGDVSHRTSKDLDLLVDAEDVEKAEEILLELGYELQDERVLGNWKKTSHHLSYEHPKHGVQIEIHWRLNPHFSKAYAFDALWTRKQEIRLSNQTLYGLGDEDLLCYLTDHGARHGWFRLRWLLDIVKLLPRLDAGRVKLHFEQYGGHEAAGQAWILSSSLLQARIPAELTAYMMYPKCQRLAGMSLHYILRIVQLNPVPEKSVALHYNAYLFLLMSGRQRAAYILNKCIPNSRDAVQLPLPRTLHFLYIPLRPFLWLWRRRKRAV
ncbi:nucleotidyltransferase domain-containing protein [Paenibacillus lemnae]|uniref:Nucleotidyltransferase family protein n=1 Tax=Paenibacillus lemnae TaxID=1330551 RepID=A0A848M3V7_PAELE|nr:nucleotidyltransferase family protein [Paenibacillus lemnae]NMO95718.1 nucleotidyltransferase family protein [Paenibacillus lemnae]